MEEGDIFQSDVYPVIKPNRELEKLIIFKVYKRRWFILLVLCLLNCSNSMLWLTFAPVADQAAKFMDVSLDQINWLSLVYMVVAIPLSFGATWMLDTLGLRATLVLGSWLNMLGAVLRYIAVLKLFGTDERFLFPLVMLGQTLCSLAQPLVIFTPTKLTAVWFPDHQRATANMVASMSNPLGLLFANIFSPMIVASTNNLTLLMCVYAIPAILACLLATVGIRSRAPPTPPSASAEMSNSEPFLQGIKLLMRNRAYLILLLCFGSGIAVFTCFSTLLEQVLCIRGYTNVSPAHHLSDSAHVVRALPGFLRALRGSVHRVWDRRSSVAGCLRGQDQTVHRSYQGQHELLSACWNSLRGGVSDAGPEGRRGSRRLCLRLLRLLHLPGCYGAVGGVLLSRGRGHVSRPDLYIRTDPVCYLHHAASVVDQENGRLPPVDLLCGGRSCAQLEGLHAGHGRDLECVYLLFRYLLQHKVPQTPGRGTNPPAG
ncbi:solute carrier family 49 member A3 isoform X2 [Osmerus eperlanus]|uniref:solute carrier family 49 member A3 isoform X2 n=1 Tax=Osmerus eperlanus TaxID=29151 RepID=UPI002E1041AA